MAREKSLYDRDLAVKAFKCLEGLGASATKSQRISALIDKVLAGAIGLKAMARDQASDVVRVHNDYSLVKERLCAAYARDVKRDTFGKKDERRFLVSLAKILQQEGLAREGYYHRSELLGYFTAQDVSQREKSFDSSYDRGMRYELDVLDGVKRLGANAALTAPGADFGVDILFEYRELKFAGQCKALQKAVGVKAIQEVVTGRQHYAADRAVVFSKNGFSDAALSLATTNDVVCIDGIDLSTLDRQIAVSTK